MPRQRTENPNVNNRAQRNVLYIGRMGRGQAPCQPVSKSERNPPPFQNRLSSGLLRRILFAPAQMGQVRAPAVCNAPAPPIRPCHTPPPPPIHCLTGHHRLSTHRVRGAAGVRHLLQAQLPQALAEPHAAPPPPVPPILLRTLHVGASPLLQCGPLVRYHKCQCGMWDERGSPMTSALTNTDSYVKHPL